MSSAPLHPSLALLGFTPPAVKSGAVVFGVRTALGLTDLVVPPDLARDLARSLLGAIGDSLPAAALAPREVRTGYVRARRDGRVLKPEKRAAYLRAWAETQSGVHRSLVAACRAHDLTWSSVQRWLADNRGRLRAECAAAGIKVSP